jgi:hypothetical protein
MASPVIFGQDPSKFVHPIAVDVNGNLTVVSPNGNSLMGTFAGFYENWNSGAMPAGANAHDFTVVPVGELWIATAIFTVYVGTVTNVIEAWGIKDGGTLYASNLYKPVTTAVGQSFVIQIYIMPGQNMRLELSGVTLNNTVTANYFGYKMKLP